MRNRGFDIKNNNDRFYTGIILILVGAVILLKRVGVYIPSWLYDWSAIVVLAGLISGMKVRFRGVSWIIIMAVGLFFMSDELIKDVEIRRFLWPGLIIGIGILFIFRPKISSLSQDPLLNFKPKQKADNETEFPPSSEDRIDSTSVFGEVKKMVTSKNFKGGEIVCFMGGSQINLTQADIQGPVFLEVTIVFGGAKLVVPPNWEIRSETVAVFAGIEDKRNLLPGSKFDPDKVLILSGTSVFGGIEIKSY